ncbi:uncharacterized protein LOC115980180 [Quercus lobata]|uniref:uncharacterized protein LOC115980180 n=1 Tax=Quercus lobata TaxID=97700 RepID=UPI001248A8D3|nr:uncharacterized protein LOC115980180 [Quercus lobata]
MVSSLIDPAIKWWRADVIRAIFLPFEVDTILRIPVSRRLPEDKLIWMGNTRGEFTMKSAYHIAFSMFDGKDDVGSSKGDPLKPLWKRLWHLNLPAKIKIFAWRACINGLPSRETLCARGIITDKDCPICNKELESIHHALLHCDFAIQVWSFSVDGVQWLQRNNWTFPDLAMYFLTHKSSHVLESFLTIVWTIWYNRNRTIHKDICSHPSQVWQMARNSIKDFTNVAYTNLPSSRPTLSSCWSPPPPGVFKINVDRASSELEGTSSIGVIIRDCKGDTVAALCKPLQSHYPAELVEIIALEQGILLAQEMHLPCVLCESDASNVVNAINESATGTPYRHIIQDIIQAQASFAFCTFRFLSRAFNYAAHELAQFAHKTDSHQVWYGVTPSFLESIVQADLLH